MAVSVSKKVVYKLRWLLHARRFVWMFERKKSLNLDCTAPGIRESVLACDINRYYVTTDLRHVDASFVELNITDSLAEKTQRHVHRDSRDPVFGQEDHLGVLDLSSWLRADRVGDTEGSDGSCEDREFNAVQSPDQADHARFPVIESARRPSHEWSFSVRNLDAESGQWCTAQSLQADDSHFVDPYLYQPQLATLF